ncbi:hypothetical protein [Aulosira sp. FACHB-615]|uniref:hypothetical protein n=1 Tax=Aulosira sp. FACHB-615 TaxID=2692777 RepID=UPI0016838E88|nr:hypothetical protein [Aulosira sp. FACHB-615]MBD2492599.1 hypothetical protein [Aulosira sp. FACHB-615]
MFCTTDNSTGITAPCNSVKESLAAIASLQRDVCKQLQDIRDNRLYQQRYSSFSEYCDTELGDWGGYIGVALILASAKAMNTPVTEVAGGV